MAYKDYDNMTVDQLIAALKAKATFDVEDKALIIARQDYFTDEEFEAMLGYPKADSDKHLAKIVKAEEAKKEATEAEHARLAADQAKAEAEARETEAEKAREIADAQAAQAEEATKQAETASEEAPEPEEETSTEDDESSDEETSDESATEGEEVDSPAPKKAKAKKGTSKK